MQANQYPQPSDQFNEKAKSWLSMLFCSLAFSVEIFLHKRFGERFVDKQSLLAVVLILAMPAFFAGHDTRPLFIFLGLYLIMCISARQSILWRRWRNVGREHSRYSGEPRLLRLFPRLNEIRVKRLIEPALVMVTGFIMSKFDAPLGTYLVLAGVSLFISTNLLALRERQSALDLNDLHIEAQQRAERFRSMNGHR